MGIKEYIEQHQTGVKTYERGMKPTHLKEYIELYRLSTRTQAKDGEFVHDKLIVHEEGEKYVILEHRVKDRLNYYSIYYEINNKFYYTVSMIAAMEKGSSILNTSELKLMDSYYGKYHIERKPVDTNGEDICEQVKKRLKPFTNFIKKHDLVRVREVAGTYKWYMQDQTGRREWEG